MQFYDTETEFTSGKYEGQTLQEVFEKDPKYIRHCLENIDDFYVSPSVLKALKLSGSSTGENKPETGSSFMDDMADELFESDHEDFDWEQMEPDEVDEDLLIDFEEDFGEDFDDDLDDDF